MGGRREFPAKSMPCCGGCGVGWRAWGRSEGVVGLSSDKREVGGSTPRRPINELAHLRVGFFVSIPTDYTDQRGFAGGPH